MAYSVYGYITDESGNALSGVKILPYFKKVDSGSDSSKWSDTWYTSDDLGYYGYSPEDANLLTSEGAYKKDKDKFYTVYVYPDENKDSLTITRASFHQHTIPSADDLEVNIVCELKRSPVIDSYTFPNAVLTKHAYVMGETSHTDIGWVDNRSQKLTYDTIAIFDGHQLVDTVYDWGEINEREIGNNSSDTYSYTVAGVYDISIRVREKWNTNTLITKQVTVKYNEPVMDFNWTPTLTNDWQGTRIKGQELITFHNTSTSLDDRMSDPYTYKWTVTDELQDGSDNTQVWDNQTYDYEPSHAFQSAGTKTVTLLCYWNDGFEDKTVSVQKTLEIYAFDIVPEFDWDVLHPTRRNQDVTFNPDTTIGDTDKISRYDWVIDDNYPASETDLMTFDSGTSIFNEHSTDGSVIVDNQYTITDTQYPVVKFHSMGDKTVIVTITYDNGWVNVTKTLSHTVTPVKYVVEPVFTISDTAPMGRDKVVTITNTTAYAQDTFDLGYTIDWAVDDKYSTCNLDNPNPGTETDHSDIQLDVAKDTTVHHNYENALVNEIELTIRYDDGWQQQTKRLVQTVTPVVYPAPVPEFTWDILIPADRTQVVTFSDTTSDPDTRFRAYDWIIPDSYNKWNPDSSNYGVGVVDNTQVISYSTASTLKPTHAFQDNISRSIEMVYYYDDGFCERTVNKINEITFTEYTIIPEFTATGSMVGKVEVQYEGTSTGDTDRMLDYKWTWNDRTFPDGSDEITVRNDELTTTVQPFTWQYPSRKPYSAVNGDTAENINKEVELEVRIDNGWRDNTDDDGYGVDNDSNGGIVYYRVTHTYEATPKEISSELTYTCNDSNYSH